MSNQPAARTRTSETRYAETPIQKVALVVGIVFLLVGIAGFIPGLTSNVDQMTFAGHDSDALLLGVFQVSIFHNLVHLLYGVAGLLLARTIRGARSYLVVGGIIYLVLFVYGLIFHDGEDANFVPFNSADNWLHLVLGAGMILLGLLLSRRRDGSLDSNH